MHLAAQGLIDKQPGWGSEPARHGAHVADSARDPCMVKDPRLTPMRLDVTSSVDVATTAAACGDVNILINNAGLMFAQRVRYACDVQNLCPGPGAKRRGMIVNMLAVVSRYVYPCNSTYSAIKHAALAVTDRLRIELKAQGTRLMGVYAMAALSGDRFQKERRPCGC